MTRVSLFNVSNKLWWKWALYGTIFNHQASNTLSKKIGVNNRDNDFLAIGVLQWILFVMHIILSRMAGPSSSLRICLIFEILVWLYYIYKLIKLRYRFNCLYFEDHCLLMR